MHLLVTPRLRTIRNGLRLEPGDAAIRIELPNHSRRIEALESGVGDGLRTSSWREEPVSTQKNLTGKYVTRDEFNATMQNLNQRLDEMRADLRDIKDELLYRRSPLSSPDGAPSGATRASTPGCWPEP